MTRIRRIGADIKEIFLPQISQIGADFHGYFFPVYFIDDPSISIWVSISISKWNADDAD